MSDYWQNDDEYAQVVKLRNISDDKLEALVALASEMADWEPENSDNRVFYLRLGELAQGVLNEA